MRRCDWRSGGRDLGRRRGCRRRSDRGSRGRFGSDNNERLRRCCGSLFCRCGPGRCSGRGSYDHRRSNDHVLRRNHGHGGPRCCRASGGFGHDGSCGRPGGNGGGRRLHDGRRRPRLRHNFARLRAGGSGRCRCRNRSRRSRWLFWRLCHNRRGCFAGRHMALARFCLLFLFFGQNGLHHVAGLGDVGEIDFWCNRLGRARSPGVT